jgi:hypothetical protein
MLLTMQAFHTYLFSTPDAYDALHALLARLTRISPAQMVALKSDLEWTPW